MENNNYIQQELVENCPSIVELEKNLLYSVPADYFKNLEVNILEKIRSGTEPYYHFIRHTPYTVPEGYFSTLSDEIKKRISLNNEEGVFEELEAISPLLNTIRKENPYTVPDGYFAKQPDLPKAIQVKSTAKLVDGRSFAKMYKYLVAAVFIGFIAIGLYLFNARDTNDTSEQLNQVTAEVQKLSEHDIIEFLKNTSRSGVVIDNKQRNESKELDIKKSIEKMSDKEIEEFLKESGAFEGI